MISTQKFEPGDRPQGGVIRQRYTVAGPHSSGTRLVKRLMSDCTGEAWWHTSWPTEAFLVRPEKLVWVWRNHHITARSQVANNMVPTMAEAMYSITVAWQQLNLQLQLEPDLEVIVIKYEELVTDPARVTNILSAWWDGPWNNHAFQEKIYDGNAQYE